MGLDLHEQQEAFDETLREMSRIKGIVTDAVADGVQSALRAVKQGREAAEDAVHDARHAIRRNPFQAAGLLLAVGVIIGSLITFALQRD